MSYTLRGRIESRLAALLPVVVAACVLALAEHKWWPVEAAGLMLGIGLALDLPVYHRLLRYQPGWVALPLGALELAAVLGIAEPEKGEPGVSEQLRADPAAGEERDRLAGRCRDPGRPHQE